MNSNYKNSKKGDNRNLEAEKDETDMQRERKNRVRAISGTKKERKKKMMMMKN